MAVIYFLLQGDLKNEPQAPDKIGVLVAVIYHGMHHLHRWLARIKIKAQDERQEIPGS